MNQVQKDRLLKVARALRESADPSMFSMGCYGYDECNSRAHREANVCGTPACALGHYAFREDLQRTFLLVGNSVTTRDGHTIDYFSDEVEEHFGLAEDEASTLFGTDGCGDARTPKAAARFIEKFVEGKS